MEDSRRNDWSGKLFGDFLLNAPLASNSREYSLSHFSSLSSLTQLSWLILVQLLTMHEGKDGGTERSQKGNIVCCRLDKWLYVWFGVECPFDSTTCLPLSYAWRQRDSLKTIEL